MTKFYLIDPECYNSYPGGNDFYLRSELKFSKELYLKGELTDGVLYDSDGNKYEVHWYRKIRKNRVIEVHSEDRVSYLVPGIYEGKVDLHSYKGIKTVKFPMYYIYTSNDGYHGNLNWKSWMPAIGGGLKNETTVQNWLRYGKMSCREYRRNNHVDTVVRIIELKKKFNEVKTKLYNRNREVSAIYSNGKPVDVGYSIAQISEAFDKSVSIGAFLIFTIDGRYFMRNSTSFSFPIQGFYEIDKDSYERLIDSKSYEDLKKKFTKLNDELNHLFGKFRDKVTVFIGIEAEEKGFVNVGDNSVVINIIGSRYDRKLIIPFRTSDEDTLTETKEVYEAWKKVENYLS